VSKISADTVEAKTTNGDLVLQGNGTGVPDLASGTKLNGTALTDTFSTPNLIINGDMRIAARGTVTGVTTSVYGGPDRFKMLLNTCGTWTVEQAADGPDGFADSLKLTATTADASPAVSDYALLYQHIEGQNLQHIKKGLAAAESLTVQFWVKSSLTGNLQVNIRDTDNSRIIGTTVTVSVANTWEYKTATFAGDTTGALNNDNGGSLLVEWFLGGGTDFTSGAVPTSWEANANTDRGAGDTLNVVGTSSATFQLTGVKLEVGSTATAFVPDDYSTALAKCQRYYEKSYNAGVTPGSSSLGSFFGGQIENSSINGDKLPGPNFKVSKRTAPTVVTYGTSGTVATFSNGGGIDLAAGSCTVNLTGTEAFVPYQASGGTITTTNRACWYHWTADAEL
jgi:hypothetical protein